MARTAKTNHVMSLVGEKSKKAASSKDEGKTQKEKKDSLKPINPALLPIEEELRFAQRRYSDPASGIHTSTTDNGEQSDSAAAHNSSHNSRQTDSASEHNSADDSGQTALTSAQEFSDKTGQAPAAYKNNRENAEHETEETVEKGKEAITAVVPELVNQELDAIVKRFRIAPTDSNLWQLTKAALESIRPEFSLNEEDYREKCGRLRQKVILEMTKAAIKVSKNNRK